MSALEHSGVRALNRAALALALLLLVGLAALWAWDRLRPLPPIAWAPTAFVALRAPAEALPSGERWIVAVNPACGHCRRHFEWLAARVAGRAAPPALGVLVVDVGARPDTIAFVGATPAGVWWDHDGLWRRRWGRRLYGETYRFDSNGRLIGLTRADEVPDSAHVAPTPAPGSKGR